MNFAPFVYLITLRTRYRSSFVIYVCFRVALKKQYAAAIALRAPKSTCFSEPDRIAADRALSGFYLSYFYTLRFSLRYEYFIVTNKIIPKFWNETAC